jgi:hypothetical protein
MSVLPPDRVPVWVCDLPDWMSTHVDLSRVETCEDFTQFLSVVLADFLATGASEWENGTLERFLDAFAAYADARVVDVPEQQ